MNMSRHRALRVGATIVLVTVVGLGAGLGVRRFGKPRPAAGPESPLAGSTSCRPCHEKFYRLWSTSRHGLAMQPFTATLAGRTFSTGGSAEIQVGTRFYRFDPNTRAVRERGESGERTYPVSDILGGKQVIYLLTKLERGRLQVLPLAFDVRRREWFDTAASAARHFVDRRDRPVDWRDPLYTFNLSCFGCHVSQLATNYDSQTNSYHTTWAEPGINCETCHGPSADHVRTFQAAGTGRTSSDLRIVVTKSFTARQHNDSCSSCHAKATPLTKGFGPGDRFFDHFDLATLEDQDFYPDGRDLGENYTYTSWLLNACAARSGMHCLRCHTSSGRFRFAGGRSSESCLPCHAERVRNPTPHTHHAAASEGSRCLACHMPVTEFARMRRSDHSFRPPSPTATLAFGSPNACNGCHADRDAAWADRQVRVWHKDDFQSRQLGWAYLVDAARKRDWRGLPRMLAYITSTARNEVVAASLIRLLNACPDHAKVVALVRALKDASPLVRAAAAAALDPRHSSEARDALVAATRDEYRLVRLRASGTLAGYPSDSLAPAERQAVEEGRRELIASFLVRPDNWAGHYNLGNYYLERHEYGPAVEAYAAASTLRGDTPLPLVNAAVAYANLGQPALARESLTRALALEPGNAAAYFNLGLLDADEGNVARAKLSLRAALKAEPQMAAAAYNLGLLMIVDRREEALALLRQAASDGPGEPRYAYTLAYHLNEAGARRDAARELRTLLSRFPEYWDAYALLGSISEALGDRVQARGAYRHALQNPALPLSARRQLETRLAEVR
jgi:tetratricopeptide (TPR) repeat protein